MRRINMVRGGALAGLLALGACGGRTGCNRCDGREEGEQQNEAHLFKLRE